MNSPLDNINPDSLSTTPKIDTTPSNTVAKTLPISNFLTQEIQLKYNIAGDKSATNPVAQTSSTTPVATTEAEKMLQPVVIRGQEKLDDKGTLSEMKEFQTEAWKLPLYNTTMKNAEVRELANQDFIKFEDLFANQLKFNTEIKPKLSEGSVFRLLNNEGAAKADALQIIDNSDNIGKLPEIYKAGQTNVFGNVEQQKQFADFLVNNKGYDKKQVELSFKKALIMPDFTGEGNNEEEKAKSNAKKQKDHFASIINDNSKINYEKIEGYSYDSPEEFEKKQIENYKYKDKDGNEKELKNLDRKYLKSIRETKEIRIDRARDNEVNLVDRKILLDDYAYQNQQSGGVKSEDVKDNFAFKAFKGLGGLVAGLTNNPAARLALQSGGQAMEEGAARTTAAVANLPIWQGIAGKTSAFYRDAVHAPLDYGIEEGDMKFIKSIYGESYGNFIIDADANTRVVLGAATDKFNNAYGGLKAAAYKYNPIMSDYSNIAGEFERRSKNVGESKKKALEITEKSRNKDGIQWSSNPLENIIAPYKQDFKNRSGATFTTDFTKDVFLPDLEKGWYNILKNASGPVTNIAATLGNQEIRTNTDTEIRKISKVAADWSNTGFDALAPLAIGGGAGRVLKLGGLTQSMVTTPLMMAASQSDSRSIDRFGQLGANVLSFQLQALGEMGITRLFGPALKTGIANLAGAGSKEAKVLSSAFKAGTAGADSLARIVGGTANWKFRAISTLGMSALDTTSEILSGIVGDVVARKALLNEDVKMDDEFYKTNIITGIAFGLVPNVLDSQNDVRSFVYNRERIKFANIQLKSNPDAKTALSNIAIDLVGQAGVKAETAVEIRNSMVNNNPDLAKALETFPGEVQYKTQGMREYIKADKELSKSENAGLTQALDRTFSGFNPDYKNSKENKVVEISLINKDGQSSKSVVFSVKDKQTGNYKFFNLSSLQTLDESIVKANLAYEVASYLVNDGTIDKVDNAVEFAKITYDGKDIYLYKEAGDKDNTYKSLQGKEYNFDSDGLKSVDRSEFIDGSGLREIVDSIIGAVSEDLNPMYKAQLVELRSKLGDVGFLSAFSKKVIDPINNAPDIQNVRMDEDGAEIQESQTPQGTETETSQVEASVADAEPSGKNTKTEGQKSEEAKQIPQSKKLEPAERGVSILNPKTLFLYNVGKMLAEAIGTSPKSIEEFTEGMKKKIKKLSQNLVHNIAILEINGISIEEAMQAYLDYNDIESATINPNEKDRITKSFNKLEADAKEIVSKSQNKEQAEKLIKEYDKARDNLIALYEKIKLNTAGGYQLALEKALRKFHQAQYNLYQKAFSENANFRKKLTDSYNNLIEKIYDNTKSAEANSKSSTTTSESEADANSKEDSPAKAQSRAPSGDTGQSPDTKGVQESEATESKSKERIVNISEKDANDPSFANPELSETETNFVKNYVRELLKGFDRTLDRLSARFKILDSKFVSSKLKIKKLESKLAATKNKFSREATKKLINAEKANILKFFLDKVKGQERSRLVETISLLEGGSIEVKMWQQKDYANFKRPKGDSQNKPQTTEDASPTKRGFTLPEPTKETRDNLVFLSAKDKLLYNLGQDIVRALNPMAKGLSEMKKLLENKKNIDKLGANARRSIGILASMGLNIEDAINTYLLYASSKGEVDPQFKAQTARKFNRLEQEAIEINRQAGNEDLITDYEVALEFLEDTLKLVIREEGSPSLTGPEQKAIENFHDAQSKLIQQAFIIKPDFKNKYQDELDSLLNKSFKDNKLVEETKKLSNEDTDEYQNAIAAYQKELVEETTSRLNQRSEDSKETEDVQRLRTELDAQFGSDLTDMVNLRVTKRLAPEDTKKTGDKTEAKPSVKFSLTPVSKNKPALLTLHNLNEGNVIAADELGGLAAPSIAITTIETVFKKFGEITLIGDSKLIDPRNKKVQVYDSDIYSPRFPSVSIELKKRELRSIGIDMENIFDGVEGVYKYSSSFESHLKYLFRETNQDRAIKDETLQKYWLLKDKKLTVQEVGKLNSVSLYDLMKELRKEYIDFVYDLSNQLVKDKKIFKGYTYDGTARYSKLSLKSVVAEMSRQIQNGEGFSYDSAAQLRSVIARRFNSLQSIQDSRDQIDSKGLKEVADSFDKRVWSLKFKLGDLSGNYDFAIVDFVTDLMGSRSLQSTWESYGMSKPNEEIQQELAKLIADLKDAPTDYFEAKFQRAVDFAEFKGALVPSDLSQRARKVLEDAGLEIREYDVNSKTARKEELKDFVEELDGKYGNVKYSLTKEDSGSDGNSPESKAEAFTDEDGNVTIIEENLRGKTLEEKIQRAKEVFLHEVLVHSYINKRLKKDPKSMKEWKRELDSARMYLFERAEALAKEAGYNSVEEFVNDYGWKMEDIQPGGKHEHDVLEELLARSAEKLGLENPSWFQKFVGNLQRFFSKYFGVNLGREGVISLLARNKRWLEQNPVDGSSQSSNQLGKVKFSKTVVDGKQDNVFESKSEVYYLDVLRTRYRDDKKYLKMAKELSEINKEKVDNRDEILAKVVEIDEKLEDKKLEILRYARNIDTDEMFREEITELLKPKEELEEAIPLPPASTFSQLLINVNRKVKYDKKYGKLKEQLSDLEKELNQSPNPQESKIILAEIEKLEDKILKYVKSVAGEGKIANQLSYFANQRERLKAQKQKSLKDAEKSEKAAAQKPKKQATESVVNSPAKPTVSATSNVEAKSEATNTSTPQATTASGATAKTKTATAIPQATKFKVSTAPKATKNVSASPVDKADTSTEAEELIGFDKLVSELDETLAGDKEYEKRKKRAVDSLNRANSAKTADKSKELYEKADAAQLETLSYALPKINSTELKGRVNDFLKYLKFSVGKTATPQSATTPTSNSTTQTAASKTKTATATPQATTSTIASKPKMAAVPTPNPTPVQGTATPQAQQKAQNTAGAKDDTIPDDRRYSSVKQAKKVTQKEVDEVMKKQFWDQSDIDTVIGGIAAGLITEYNETIHYKLNHFHSQVPFHQHMNTFKIMNQLFAIISSTGNSKVKNSLTIAMMNFIQEAAIGNFEDKKGYVYDHYKKQLVGMSRLIDKEYTGGILDDIDNIGTELSVKAEDYPFFSEKAIATANPFVRWLYKLGEHLFIFGQSRKDVDKMLQSNGPIRDALDKINRDAQTVNDAIRKTKDSETYREYIKRTYKENPFNPAFAEITNNLDQLSSKYTFIQNGKRLIYEEDGKIYGMPALQQELLRLIEEDADVEELKLVIKLMKRLLLDNVKGFDNIRNRSGWRNYWVEERIDISRFRYASNQSGDFQAEVVKLTEELQKAIGRDMKSEVVKELSSKYIDYAKELQSKMFEPESIKRDLDFAGEFFDKLVLPVYQATLSTQGIKYQPDQFFGRLYIPRTDDTLRVTNSIGADIDYMGQMLDGVQKQVDPNDKSKKLDEEVSSFQKIIEQIVGNVQQTSTFQRYTGQNMATMNYEPLKGNYLNLYHNSARMAVMHVPVFEIYTDLAGIFDEIGRNLVIDPEANKGREGKRELYASVDNRRFMVASKLLVQYTSAMKSHTTWMSGPRNAFKRAFELYIIKNTPTFFTSTFYSFVSGIVAMNRQGNQLSIARQFLIFLDALASSINLPGDIKGSKVTEQFLVDVVNRELGLEREIKSPKDLLKRYADTLDKIVSAKDHFILPGILYLPGFVSDTFMTITDVFNDITTKYALKTALETVSRRKDLTDEQKIDEIKSMLYFINPKSTSVYAPLARGSFGDLTAFSRSAISTTFTTLKTGQRPFQFAARATYNFPFISDIFFDKSSPKNKVKARFELQGKKSFDVEMGLETETTGELFRNYGKQLLVTGVVSTLAAIVKAIATGDIREDELRKADNKVMYIADTLKRSLTPSSISYWIQLMTGLEVTKAAYMWAGTSMQLELSYWNDVGESVKVLMGDPRNREKGISNLIYAFSLLTFNGASYRAGQGATALLAPDTLESANRNIADMFLRGPTKELKRDENGEFDKMDILYWWLTGRRESNAPKEEQIPVSIYKWASGLGKNSALDDMQGLTDNQVRYQNERNRGNITEEEQDILDGTIKVPNQEARKDVLEIQSLNNALAGAAGDDATREINTRKLEEFKNKIGEERYKKAKETLGVNDSNIGKSMISKNRSGPGYIYKKPETDEDNKNEVRKELNALQGISSSGGGGGGGGGSSRGFTKGVSASAIVSKTSKALDPNTKGKGKGMSKKKKKLTVAQISSKYKSGVASPNKFGKQAKLKAIKTSTPRIGPVGRTGMKIGKVSSVSSVKSVGKVSSVKSIKKV